MLKLNSRKATVLIGTSAAVIAVAGVAYAYYAGGIAGSGSGSASTADSPVDDLTFAASAISDLVPGTSKTTTVTFTNPNDFAVSYPATDVEVSSVDGPDGCDDNDTALLSGSATLPAGVVGAGLTKTLTVTVSMEDSLTVDQTDCNDGDFTITYSATPSV